MNEMSWLDRRQVLTVGAAVAGTALTGSALPAFAQRAQGPAEVPVDELMKPGDLPDLALGPNDAKVTVVEYASMTCGHCMAFHTKVFPEIKKKYIDTGKIRFVFREFPLDARAFAASMLSRCAGSPERSFAMVDALFHTQENWAFVKENPTPKLFEIAKQAGFTQESFDKCLTDQKLLDQLTAIHTRGNEVFGVNATPTFFINGKRLQAAPVVEEFDKVIEPLLSQG
ncbi:DsbA family protein [Hyphomicrobium sp. CS1GBMeth3]|uniref:DsbA family protein n=1 Tax=Hyphomicrobium sp. CS1GBMeth3 TaxID=1892845 RepID=UPI000931AD47|nr:DsbA family protein [Hyphomicrobium sp. CS1GBMeth3]